MTEGEKTRLIAWGPELRTMHDRLREALRVTRTALGDGGAAEPATRDLPVFCHGFCAALTGHHAGEDRELFPAIAAPHPELRLTLRSLEQDHSMTAHLITALQAAIGNGASPAELDRDVGDNRT